MEVVRGAKSLRTTAVVKSGYVNLAFFVEVVNLMVKMQNKSGPKSLP